MAVSSGSAWRREFGLSVGAGGSSSAKNRSATAALRADDAPEVHSADTHGATELVFAAFDLLGRRFIPRLHDIADVPLYGLGPGQPQLAADMLLTRRVGDELIAGQWEELMRLAGSIKRGWIVPPTMGCRRSRREVSR